MYSQDQINERRKRFGLVVQETDHQPNRIQPQKRQQSTRAPKQDRQPPSNASKFKPNIQQKLGNQSQTRQQPQATHTSTTSMTPEKEEEIWQRAITKKRRAARFGQDIPMSAEENLVIRKRRFAGMNIESFIFGGEEEQSQPVVAESHPPPQSIQTQIVSPVKDPIPVPIEEQKEPVSIVPESVEQDKPEPPTPPQDEEKTKPTPKKPAATPKKKVAAKKKKV
ncbi:hypothetical protein BLNAU_7987 [Blattamonas nauphoetae]|uniref:Uncharacterized protein n=1 Tax=Blattamonas nauphoetae TaxID=2049346 RepID=A0ABQ9Y076_9EUKA|nr:hypothetical protein BLNAU_7987 [Blattamonas nauphoetae]